MKDRRPGKPGRGIPHKQAGDITFPAGPGLKGPRPAMAATACGIEVPLTLTSPSWERVRCPACREALALLASSSSGRES